MPSAGSTVEYYFVADDGFFRVEWDGPDPSFVMLAPLHEALDALGAFSADAEAAWPGGTGQPYFLLPGDELAEVREAFATVTWSDYLTPGRIRDSLGVSDTHAAEMVDLAMREAERLASLLAAAEQNGCGLLCVVY